MNRSVSRQNARDRVRSQTSIPKSKLITTVRVCACAREDKTFSSVLAWLSLANPREKYQAARKLQQRGTGQWFTTSKAFADWKSERNAVIWLHGSGRCDGTPRCFPGCF